MKHFARASIVCALVAAAASPVAYGQPAANPVIDASSWRDRVEATMTEFDTHAKLSGRETKTGSHLGQPEFSARFVSLVPKDGGPADVLLVLSNIYSADNWRRWSSAATNRAQDLRVMAISRDVVSCRGGCTYLETVAAVVPPDDLRIGVEGNLRIRFQASSGASHVVKVEPQDAADIERAVRDIRRILAASNKDNSSR